jgi:hypothetical protein
MEAINGSVQHEALNIDDQAFWDIEVPSAATYSGTDLEVFRIYITGTDANSGLPATQSQVVSRQFTVQLKPNLYLAHEILSPESARIDGDLSHRQSITIDVTPQQVNNTSTLSYGEITGAGTVELDNAIFSTYNFEQIEGESYTQQFDNLGQTLQFQVRAPEQNRTALVNFKFKQLPLDRNSGTNADIDADSGTVSIPITVREKEIKVSMMNELASDDIFTRGSDHHVLMAFEIVNEGYLDDLFIDALSIKFVPHEDTTSLSSETVLNLIDNVRIINYDQYEAGSSRPLNMAEAIEYGNMNVDENNTSNPLKIEFQQIGQLASDAAETILVLAKFKSRATSRKFRAILSSVNAYDDSTASPVTIIDEEGRRIDGNPYFESQIFSVISNDPKEAFGNYPNPFGREPNTSTNIRFLLRNTSDVKLLIFSLAGELVKSAWNENLTGLPRGLHEVKWDGKNDRGTKVLNGVYLCAIEVNGTGGTERFLTKIAYIK